VEQNDDMIQEESLDENQIIEQGQIHELCSSISPEEVPKGSASIRMKPSSGEYLFAKKLWDREF
jgi:hypothetical protein